nr:hypothetical protein [Porphyridium purpureum]
MYLLMNKCRNKFFSNSLLKISFRFYKTIYNNDRTVFSSCKNENDNFFELWTISLSKLDDFLRQGYLYYKTSLLTVKIINIVKKTVSDYDFLILLYCKKTWSKFKTYKTHNNFYIFSELNKVQILFIESFSALIFCNLLIKKNSNVSVYDKNELSFKNFHQEKQRKISQLLRITKFGRSFKKATVKKNYPYKAILSKYVITSIYKSVKVDNDALLINMVSECDIKNSLKNYTGGLVKRIWVIKLNTNRWNFSEVLTLKDKVLQTIFYKALNSLVVFHMNTNTFGFKLKKTAYDAIILLIKHLSPSNNLVNWKTAVVKRYKKICKHVDWFNKTTKEAVQKHRKKIVHNKFIRVNIERNFDNLSTTSILVLYPLCNQYKFLLKTWLSSSVYGPVFFNFQKPEKYTSKIRSPYGYTGTSHLFNCITSGFEEFCFKRSNCKYSKKTSSSSSYRSRPKILFLMYLSNVLIIGKNPKVNFLIVFDRITTFLAVRGFNMKNSNTVVQTFSPKFSFKFLGHRFIKYPSFRSTWLQKLNYKAITTRNQHIYSNNSFLTLIDNKLLNAVSFQIKNFLSRKNTPLPVDLLIKKVNKLVYKTVIYFSYFNSIQSQLKYLDHVIFKQFWSFLVNKFRSIKKVKSFVKKNFYTEKNRIFSGTVTLLRTTDFKSISKIKLKQLNLKRSDSLK